MAAAGVVLKPAVFYLRGIIRVAGAGAVAQIGVIAGAGIGIADDGGNGRAAGVAVQQAAQEFRPILLPARGGKIILPGRAAVEERLQALQIHGKPRRDAVQGHADGCAVGLAEDG